MAARIQTQFLYILGQQVRIDCSRPELNKVLRLNFGAMAAPNSDRRADLEYRIEASADSAGIALLRVGQPTQNADSDGDLLFLLEKDLTVELQKRRADCFFMHAAAVEWNGGCYLLAAESGGGKSTTTWGLVHHGFRYLSDELSAIDLETMMVLPYPHAICLKQLPPPNYPLPEVALHLGRTIHVPTSALPSSLVAAPRRLRGVFFVKHSPDLGSPAIHSVGRAEAAARIYVCALNALAHENRGLDASVRIAEHAHCFALSAGDLAQTCALIRSTIETMGTAVNVAS